MSDRNDVCALFDGLAARIRSADLRTIGFTSAVFGEGTSTLALGASLSLASMSSGPVLLVDANWLEPSLTSDAGVESEPGVADVLRGSADLDQAIIRTARPGLVFLPAGDLSQGRPPLEALHSLIHPALPSFGAIVVDLAPALADESLVRPWAGSLQQLFVVVRSGVTPLALVRRAVQGFAPARPQVVLNGMRGWTEHAARSHAAVT